MNLELNFDDASRGWLGRCYYLPINTIVINVFRMTHSLDHYIFESVDEFEDILMDNVMSVITHEWIHKILFHLINLEVSNAYDNIYTSVESKMKSWENP